MSLSEDEIQQLELLAMLREHGKLTDEQFQRQTSVILRSSTIRHRPQHPLVRKIFSKNTKRPRKQTLIPQPKKELILERHYLADEPVYETPVSPNVLPGTPPVTSASGRYRVRPRQPSLSTLVSMRHEDKGQSTSLIATLGTVSAAILLTVLLARSTPLDSMIQRIESSSAAAIALPSPVVPTAPSFVDPMFGPLAEKRCRSSCASKDATSQQFCFDSCQRLSVAEFGRRVSLEPLDPIRDARSMITACSTKNLGVRKAIPQKQWAEQVRQHVSQLEDSYAAGRSKDFGSARLRYERNMATANSLTAPVNGLAEERRLSEALARSACLQSHIALTELGISVAHENNDTFSLRFYQSIFKTLQSEAQRTDPAVIRSVRRLPRNDTTRG